VKKEVNLLAFQTLALQGRPWSASQCGQFISSEGSYISQIKTSYDWYIHKLFTIKCGHIILVLCSWT